MFQPEPDADDPIHSWRASMDEVMQRNYSQLRFDVERMETNISIAEGDIFRKEEEQFFIRADEMQVNDLLKRQADEVNRLEAAFKDLLRERALRKASKLAEKRMYKEAKTRYIKIKHQEKVKQTADAVIVASEQHRRRLDQLLQLVDSKHKRQREGMLVSQDRRVKSQRAILELEMRNMPQILRDEVMFDWESKLAHQRNADKLSFDQLRDTQQAELAHRKERFDLETKAMSEVADLHIEQLREMGEMEHKQKLDMIIQVDQVEIAREKVSVLKLTGMHHVELRKLKAAHKGQLATLIRQTKSMARARERKWKDAMGAEMLKSMDQANDAMSSEGGSNLGAISESASSASGISRQDSSSSFGSVDDDTEAEVRAAEEAVQKLMAEDYAKANAGWNAAQEQHKLMYARHKEDRRRLAQQHRDQLRQVESDIKNKYDELDLAHESQRRDLRKSHEATMAELVQFMHKEYLVSRSIRLADRKSLAERRVLVSILNTIADGVVSINPNGSINRFNLAAEKMFGYKAEEVIGENVKILTPVSHAVKHDGYLKHYMKTGQRKIIGTGRQDFARRKDGSEFPCFLNLSEVREEGSVVLFTGIIRDLEAKLAREERIHRTRQEKQLEMEALVSQLDAERFQTRKLIGQILPSTIADQLMNGEPVRPTKFNDVTVLYTDLVGFTQISSGLGALEVVDLLNQLYTAFDDVIGLYDVYKVETIGDAYMVASGVPKLNGNNHVAEIAKLALHLIKTIPTIKVPGRPDVQLKMRVGIHTGPIVAGVVGRKMPRYCLFGDTVTIANKMESNSVAGKVLVSDTTYRRLQTFDGYSFEPRGDVVIPGKGTVKTMFLNGLTGFNPDVLSGAYSKAAAVPKAAFEEIAVGPVPLPVSSDTFAQPQGVGM
ncbi:adenylate and guanylate cyclase catalytic domain-domain-containing protein [Catenaria anguillulae PL171]|uniref:Adenylate and guanylate cyclase catalytic domain-domain-containing protein n=1 Tax=Catenaria anguillulae PL171 TaxID=765915 RepID=A0A1Y2I0V7_9FUNG|nr:adenylate and guanylate cyclase catalytic domain-domain-containing protein [Catenaria anguillulae PL171]